MSILERSSSIRNRPPSPVGTPIMGHLKFIRDNPLEFMERCHRELGDVVFIRLGPIKAHFIFHPDGVHHFFVKNVDNYVKDVRAYRKLRQLAGLGLLTGDGELWRRQRRLAQPSFTPRKVLAFAETISDCTQDLARRWDASASSGTPVPVADDMMHLALRIICRTMLGTDIGGEVSSIGRAVTVALEEILHRINHMTDFLEWMPTKRNRDLTRSIRFLDDTIMRIIEDRRAIHARGRDPEEHDLLDGFLLARDEVTGKGMSDRELLDEVKTIFLAGHETTATMLAWAWYHLSQNPEVERRLHKEVDVVLGDRPPRAEDLPNLKYARQVLDETMRLTPPVWATERRAVGPDTIGGYQIRPGEFVMASQFVTHRHPEFWSDPLTFNPDRFAEGGEAYQHRYQYFPFGAGPRICIGIHFALLEGVIILASIAQQFRLRLAPGVEVKPHPLITLRPDGNIPMILERRRVNPD